MKNLTIISFFALILFGWVNNVYSADKVFNVDDFIQQTGMRCYEVQKTIDEVSRFMSEYKKNARVDVERWGVDVLSEFYGILCGVQSLLENENKTLYLYKHVEPKYKATVSKYLAQEFTARVEGFLESSMQRAKASLDAYRKGDVDINVIQLSGRMVDQIALSGKVLLDIKKFYTLENTKAKAKN